MKATLVSSGGGGNFCLWDYPRQHREYVVGIDVAEGKVRDMNSAAKRDMILATSSEKPDYSVAVVLDLDSGQHVASWHGYMRPSDFGVICLAVGTFFNDGLLAWEHNNHGIVLTDMFVGSGYPNLYRRHILAGRIPNDGLLTNEFGWVTTAASKPLLIARISEMIHANPRFTMDRGLVNELRTMEYDPVRGEARSRGRNKDDRVIALGIALQARHEYRTGASHVGLNPAIDRLGYQDRVIWAEALQRRESRDRNRHHPDRDRSVPEPPRRLSSDRLYAELNRLAGRDGGGRGDQEQQPRDSRTGRFLGAAQSDEPEREGGHDQGPQLDRRIRGDGPTESLS